MGEVRSFGTPMVDLKAETAVLGALLVSEGHALDCRDEVADVLRDVGPKAFHNPLNQLAYTAVLNCLIDNKSTDSVSVATKLREMGELTTELFDHVHGLPGQAGMLTGAVDDVRTVLDLYRKRELHRVLLDSDRQVTSGAGVYEEVAGEVSGAISNLVDRAIRPETLHTAIEVVDAALGHILDGRVMEPGIPMGFSDLDKETGGMRPGQMIVIAGRPGHGKTTLGAQIANNVADLGLGVVFFSLEMTKEELGQRNASAKTGIPFARIRDNDVSAEDVRRLTEYADQQENFPLFVDDDPDQTIGEIALKTRKLVKDHGVKVAVVDYLQLVKPNGGGSGNKTSDVADVSEGLRKMARKLGITVIALAQLNRESASRDSGLPKLTDLRQSGQIEQDANIVILVHLEFKVDPDTGRGNEADLILAKNRGGITCERTALFDGAHSRFIDPATLI